MITSVAIIEMIHKETKLPKASIAKIVAQFVSQVSASLAIGDSVQIKKFGTLEVREVGPRSYFGGKVTTDKRKIVRFKSSRRAPWKNLASNTTQTS